MKYRFSPPLFVAILSASVSLTFISSPVGSQSLTQFTDRAAFEAAIGTPFVETFNSLPAVTETPAISTPFFSVTATTPGAQFPLGPALGTDGNAVQLRSTGFPAQADEVLVTPNGPISAFGFDFVLGPTGTAFVFVRAGTAGLPTFTLVGTPGDTGFAGFIVDPTVTDVTITNVGGDPLVSIDNFTFNALNLTIVSVPADPNNLASIGNLATVAMRALIGAPARRGNAYSPNACSPERLKESETADGSPKLAALAPMVNGDGSGAALAQATEDAGDPACVPLFGNQDLIGWIDGGYLRGNFDNRGFQAGGDYDGYVITGGVDYHLRNLGLVGLVGLSGGFSSVSSDLDDGGETRTRLGSVVGYYQYEKTPGPYVNVALGYAMGSAKLTRQAPGTPFTAQGEPDLQAWMGNALVGWDVQDDALAFGPFLNWTLGSIKVDDYTETNQGDIRLAVARQSVLNNTAELGARVQYIYEGEDVTLVPQLRLGFEYEFGDGGREVDYTLIAANAAGSVNVPDNSGSALRLGATLTGDFEGNNDEEYTISLGYDGRLASQIHTSHTITANVRVRF